MDRKKIVAIITGAISVIVAVAYLVLVQILDFRGEMLPAPIDNLGMIFSGLTKLSFSVIFSVTC